MLLAPFAVVVSSHLSVHAVAGSRTSFFQLSYFHWFSFFLLLFAAMGLAASEAAAAEAATAGTAGRLDAQCSRRRLGRGLHGKVGG